MLACLRDSKTCDPSELRNIGEFEDAIWREYSRKDEGLSLPWKKTWDAVKLRPGETSIWAGVNGHGKSTLLSYVVAGMGATGVKVCMASMEYRPALWMMRMNRQGAGIAGIGRRRVGKKGFRKCSSWGSADIIKKKNE